jgi:ribosomal protein L37AE/L43A
MGVDARILLKITNPASWIKSPEQLRQLSARLTSVIGHDNFLMKADDDRHALTFVLEETRKWAEKYPDDYPNFDPKVAVYSQDGDDVIAQPNEQFIEVHTFHRYYGEDYARGDWKTLSWIMLWCVYNIPDCEVWYGGDSSGICVERMTPERMQEMTRYYLTKGNDEYWMNGKSIYKCEFCQCGVVNSGGGGEVAFWHCDSCGSQWVTKGGRYDPTMVTKYDPYGVDREMKDPMATFAISDQIRQGTRKLYPFDGTFHAKYPYVAAEKPKELDAPAKQIEAAAD